MEHQLNGFPTVYEEFLNMLSTSLYSPTHSRPSSTSQLDYLLMNVETRSSDAELSTWSIELFKNL